MIFQIDESCLEAIDTRCEEAIISLEQLAINRRRCKNIIIADKEIFKKLKDSTCLSEPVRNIYRALYNRSAEHKEIFYITSRYIKLVLNIQGDRIQFKNRKEECQITLHEFCNSNISDKCLALTENTDDMKFYNFIAYFYYKSKGMKKVSIDFEYMMGGGDTTYKLLKKIIEARERTCLCIVDSDKKYKDCSCGQTMKKVMDLIDGNEQDIYKVIPLDIHEVENLIPLSILKKVCICKCIDGTENGIKFIEFLLSKDNSKDYPIYYFDIKNGIKKEKFILSDDATEEEKKKYKKNEKFRLYWKPYIEEFGIDFTNLNNTGSHVIPGICDRILYHVLEYINSEINEKDQIEILNDEYIKNMWLQIGKDVFSWGCVGNKIAI